MDSYDRMNFLENSAPECIRRKLSELRTKRKYSELGWMLWDAFLMLDRSTEAFKAVESVFKQLSKDELELIEDL